MPSRRGCRKSSSRSTINVKLDVPIGDLAVHEPDYKRLIAFLQGDGVLLADAARRGIRRYRCERDRARCEALGRAQRLRLPRLRGRTTRKARPEGASRLRRASQPAPRRSRRKRERRDRRPCKARSPRKRWRQRASIARTSRNSTAAKYETVRSLDAAQSLDRARARSRLCRHRHRDQCRSIRCRRSCAASRWRVAPNEACYVPLSHRQGGDGAAAACSSGEIVARPDSRRRSARCAEAAAGRSGRAQDRPESEIRLADLCRARHRDRVLRRHHADVLRGRCRPLRSRPRSAWRERYFRSRSHRLQRSDQGRQDQDHLRLRRASTRRPNMPPKTPTSRCGCGRCSSRGLPPSMCCTVYETLERPLLRVLARHGAARHFDRPPGAVAAVRRIRPGSRGPRRPRSTRSPARPVNVGSPKQIGDILFGKLQLPGGTKTKTGQWATGARLLEELAEQGHELPQKILDWRQVSKLKSTYTDALPGFVNPTTHRVHTSYALAATTTGRLSSSEPNLQNIPVRTEDGRKIRRAFIADAGHEARLRRLFADRAAAARRDRRHRAAAQGVPRRPRHPRHDRVGNVRRAGEEHAGRSAPPRQGDQFRHHLRHLRLRPRQPARHRARGGRRLYQKIFRALSRHPRLHGRDQGVREEERLCGNAVRPQMPLSRHRRVERVDPRPSTSAPRSMRGCRAPPPTSSAAP